MLEWVWKIKFPIVSVAVAKRGGRGRGRGREGKKRAPSLPFLPLPYHFRCPLRRVSSLMFLILSFKNNLNSFDDNSFSWSDARPVSSRRRVVSIRIKFSWLRAVPQDYSLTFSCVRAEGRSFCTKTDTCFSACAQNNRNKALLNGILISFESHEHVFI